MSYTKTIRKKARQAVLDLLAQAAGSPEGRRIHTRAVGELLDWRPADLDTLPRSEQPPYEGLGHPAAPSPALSREDVILITARFRTGSTLLWNLFRQTPGITAYYEPLNHRRWFDPAVRGSKIDDTHRGVSDYWKEYVGLEELARYYRLDWTRRSLYMDASAHDPDLQRYIEIMIEKAPGRPLLQFNRIDFRLAWLRHHFPKAKLVHLYRHPRDQWCSMLRKRPFPLDGAVADFVAADQYSLRAWAGDLSYRFPILDESRVRHPYALHYLIWKLSWLYGRRYADISICYEDLVRNPVPEIERIYGTLGIDADAWQLGKLVSDTSTGRWKQYADAAWYQAHESECEAILRDFLGQS